MPAPSSLQALGFSPRQAEVARLLAEGHTNAQIADALGVSAYTVQTHVESLFLKLGVRTRAAAVASAARRC